MKKILQKNLKIILMALMFIVSVAFISIPMTAYAAPAVHTAHKGSDKDGSKHEGWMAISNLEDLRKLEESGGSGYLTNDIELINTFYVAGKDKKINLCLNGHKITTKSYGCIIYVVDDATFNLFDEKGNKGMITHLDGAAGSAIEVSNRSEFVMNGGTISGNTFTFGAGVNVDNSSFTMNGGIIKGNRADGGSGGALLVTYSKVMLNGGSIKGNRANGGSGGALYAAGSEITMNGGTISGNSSIAGGGAIYCESESTFIMNDGTVSNNTSETADGGAFYIMDGSAFTINGGSISNNKAYYHGGAIFSFDSTTHIKGGNFEGNHAESAGGAIYIYENNFTIDGGVFSENTGGSNGGAIGLLATTGYITGGTFIGNHTGFCGGAVYSESSSFTVSGGNFNGNSADSDGGGLYIYYSTFVMSGGTVSENTALIGGGMALVNYYFEEPQDFSIEGGIIKDNKAQNEGDEVYITAEGLITEGTVKGSIDLDAYNIRSVKFFPNNGTGNAYTQYYHKDYDRALTKNKFTRSGYKFVNWNTKADGTGKTYNAGAKISTDAPSKLYAQWAPSRYSVKFDANGGSGTMSSQSIKYNTSTALKKNTFKKSGYKFVGWNTKADGSGTSYADEAQVKLKIYNVNKITLFAQWSPITASYKVEHYRQKVDGTYPATANETEALTGKTNASITPEVKTYKGFTAPATQTAKIKADGSLVVKYYYTRNSYKLTWDFAGGKASGSYTKGTVKYGAKITAPVPVRDGYEFTGWDKTVAAKMPAKDVTYKAKWRKLTQEEQVRNFVERFYTIILDRPAEAAGLADWTNRLISKTATGSDVAAGFINSDEFQKKKMTDEEYVTKLYRAFFDREPDKAGYEGWLKELKNGKSRD
ncbi:MAG: InlB B-repeat-containing protein, partial [Lachnospiraceae bacterium]|nr:InlB B-repeat-containing protein [Lachnospiraceae bacterium]